MSKILTKFSKFILEKTASDKMNNHCGSDGGSGGGHCYKPNADTLEKTPKGELKKKKKETNL